jgi:hypothetical protein
MKHSILTAATLAALAVASTSANALTFGAPIGIDFDGGGNSFIYADLWTERTDTGIDQNPNAQGNIFNVGDVHTFSSQHRVGTFQNDGAPVFAPLDPQAPGSPSYELTQLVTFNDRVQSFVPNGTGGGLVQFEHLADAFTNMTIYLDRVDQDGSRANPGPGAGTVSCYGGPTPCAAADGIPIMTFNLVANQSSFTSSVPGTGTGSYDLLFALTSFDPNYVDVSQLGGGTAALRFTGTLTQPLGGTPQPAASWNGVVPSADVLGPNQIFKIDGSKDFTAIPEPGSLALLGVAALGLPVVRRRRTSHAV